MLIHTRALGFPLTDALRAYSESRIASALEFVRDADARVTVRLDDINGAARGGTDMRCHVTVSLKRRRSVVAEATDADCYAAIDAAARRIRRATLRALERPHARDRVDRQRPGAL